MRLQVNAATKPLEAAQINKVRNNVARKAGKKLVNGTTFKSGSRWDKVKGWVGASRGVAVLAKAQLESKQYVHAALLRKDYVAEQRSIALGKELTDKEYNDIVWDSNGVQNRVTREDHVRYNTKYFSKANGASTKNARAHKISHFGHYMHGVCEMFAAPTGMTSTAIRNGLTSKTNDTSNKNKWFMLGTLGFVGLGTLYALGESKQEAESIPRITSESAADLLIDTIVAFPGVSSLMGLLGTLFGVASQVTVEKQIMHTKQKKDFQTDLSTNLNELLVHLKTAKGDPKVTEIMAKGMQGRHLFKKIKNEYREANHIPKILNEALAAIDLTKTDAENIVSLKRAIGRYLQIDKPAKDDSCWSRYIYAKRVTAKESHFVALISLVDHVTTRKPDDYTKDLRRRLEERGMPKLHRMFLNGLAIPAAKIDKFLGTKSAGILIRKGTKGYAEKHAAKMADPTRASRYRFKGEYMAKHIHQYPPLTRGLIIAAEAMRVFNMNVVLASNANLSRIFNNMAYNIQATVGTGPGSRSMCLSIGRCLGGLALALLIGTAVPDVAGGGDNLDLNADVDGKPVKFTVTNVGLLMFAISVPTILIMSLAQVAARAQGWEGDISKQVSRGDKTFTWDKPRLQ
jgi:hypothetical protein